VYSKRTQVRETHGHTIQQAVMKSQPAGIMKPGSPFERFLGFSIVTGRMARPKTSKAWWWSWRSWRLRWREWWLWRWKIKLCCFKKL